MRLCVLGTLAMIHANPNSDSTAVNVPPDKDKMRELISMSKCPDLFSQLVYILLMLKYSHWEVFVTFIFCWSSTLGVKNLKTSVFRSHIKLQQISVLKNITRPASEPETIEIFQGGNRTINDFDRTINDCNSLEKICIVSGIR